MSEKIKETAGFVMAFLMLAGGVALVALAMAGAMMLTTIAILMSTGEIAKLPKAGQ